jgi:serine O-acetyltransferase
VRFLEGYRQDAAFYYGVEQLSPVATMRAWLNPAIQAAVLFRLISRSGKLRARMMRYICLSVFSSDVSPDCRIEGPLSIPHPVGIVIGSGVSVGGRVTLYQNVTLGRNGRGDYPRIENDVTIFPGAVVVGNLTVGAGARVGANEFLSKSIPADSVFTTRST